MDHLTFQCCLRMLASSNPSCHCKISMHSTIPRYVGVSPVSWVTRARGA